MSAKESDLATRSFLVPQAMRTGTRQRSPRLSPSLFVVCLWYLIQHRLHVGFSAKKEEIGQAAREAPASAPLINSRRLKELLLVSDVTQLDPNVDRTPTVAYGWAAPAALLAGCYSPIHAPNGRSRLMLSQMIFKAPVNGTARISPIAPHSHPQNNNAIVTAKGFSCSRFPSTMG